MNFSVIIPARLNSTRLKNKLLMEINGEPLIIHTLKRAMSSHASSIIVATDSDEINNTIKSFGFKSVMTSSDHQSGTDRINEVINKLKINDDDILVNVQGDEPLVDPNLINNIAKAVKTSSSEFPFVSAYKKFKSYDEYLSPNNVKVSLDSNNDALTFSRNLIGNLVINDFQPKTIGHHLGIYGYKAKSIRKFCALSQPEIELNEKLEQLRALYYGLKIRLVEHIGNDMIGVDTLHDFNNVKKIITSS